MTLDQFDAGGLTAFNLGGADMALHSDDNPAVRGDLRISPNAVVRDLPCGRRTLAFSIVATLMLVFGGWKSVSAASEPIKPELSAFLGTWQIARVVGASPRGVTGADPKAILKKTLRWTATDIQSPEGDCTPRNAAVNLLTNYRLENIIWGGQHIKDLNLSKAELAKAFGKHKTLVFQDDAGCTNAVMIDRDHVIEAFKSGWIYGLDRVVP